jgi:predicted nuclease of restriction endonuclease-like (RecB) superfamily
MKPKKTPSKVSAAKPGIADRIRGIWQGAQTQAARSVNTAHVIANWLIGREIVEEQQEGRERARYGARMFEVLSQELTADLGVGFSESSLKLMRRLFLGYPGFFPIRQPLATELEANHSIRQPLATELVSLSTGKEWKPGMLHRNLSWRHYQALLRVDRPARDFYEIEAIKCHWNGRELERQINTLLYERLAKSRDKKGVMALANEGHVVKSPLDLLREPFVLEFLNLPEAHQLTETEMEARLISQLQAFLLELGDGFAFVGRQRRLTLEGDHFYPDLVFYHIRLRCYVIIDLKLNKIDHGDLGQMLLYVNYYDKEMRGEGDQPTVGLILGTSHNETVAKYVLDEKSRRIFATRYQPHLPTVEVLEAELRRERDLIEGTATSKLAAVKKVMAKRKRR